MRSIYQPSFLRALISLSPFIWGNFAIYYKPCIFIIALTKGSTQERKEMKLALKTKLELSVVLYFFLPLLLLFFEDVTEDVNVVEFVVSHALV